LLEILINLFALSISAGFIGAISGLGGGVFIVPALVLAAHMPMKVAVGASLISGVATSAGGGSYTAGIGVTAVPLPAALPLLLSGMAGLGAMARRRRVSSA